MLKLFPFQSQTLDWLKSRPIAFLALDQGLGKTVVAACDMQTPTLVVTTASMVLTWKKELALWRPELVVHAFKTNKPTPKDVDVIICNYDVLDKVDFEFKHLVADECHYAKNYKAKRTKVLCRLIQRASQVRLLSGTPVLNRPIELWPLMKACRITKMDYVSFGKRYCAGWMTPWNSWNFSGASNLDALHELLRPFMLRLTKQQVLPQLPPKTWQLIELDLPLDKQEKSLHIDHVEKVDSVPFEAMADILKMNGLRKVPLAIEHIKNALDSTDKVIVFANHRDVIQALMEGLKEFKPVKVDGQCSIQDRQESVTKFQEDSSTRVFIGNIKAAAEGLTLTAASMVIFVESSWTPSVLAQCADRAHRIGQHRAVTCQVLTISQSIDCYMLRTALQKIDIINSIVKETDMNNQAIAQKLRELAELFEATQPVKQEATQPAKQEEAKTVKKEEVEQKDFSMEDVRQVLAKLLDAGKREDAMKILKAQGVNKVGELSKDQFGPVIEQANKALA